MPAQRISHPVFARYYARLSPAMDKGGMAAHRRQLLHGLTGSAIEEAGFAIDHLDPFRFPDTRLTMPATPHLRGTATRIP